MLAADCESCLQTRPVTAAMTAISITTGNITAAPGRQSAEEWPSRHRHSCSGPPARSTSLDFYCAIFIAPMIILNFYKSFFKRNVSWTQVEKLHTFLYPKTCVFQGEKRIIFSPLFSTTCKNVKFHILLKPMLCFLRNMFMKTTKIFPVMSQRVKRTGQKYFH